jgi:F-type H+-transporting ATPase subunit b
MKVRALVVSVAFAAIAAAPSVVLAAGGDAHGGHEAVGALPTAKQGLATGITALVVFALAAAFLGVFVWPKISKGLDDRAQKIKDEIEAAELARQQAKDALEQYQQSLSQARTQAQAEIDKARAQAQQIAAELKAKADVELSAMREKAMRDIDNAKRTAVSEIYDQSTQLATIMAGKILQRNVQVQDGDRIFQESLQQLQAMKN